MPDFAVRGTSTYVLLGDGFTDWITGNDRSQAAGGHLVTLTSAEENSFVTNAFKVGFWIGLTDSGHEGVFTWVDGEPLAYTNWAPGEPDNRSGVTGRPENFVHVYSPVQGGTWNDLEAFQTGFTAGYVVEFDTPKDFLSVRSGFYALSSLSSSFVGSDLADSMAGGKGDDTMAGREGADGIKAGAGNDSLDGGEGDDVLKGGKGDDTLDGGPGDDVLIGGTGADLFDLTLPGGQDAIRDFGKGADRLHLAGFADFAAVAVAAHDTAGGLVIDLAGGASVTLVGVTLAGFTAAAVLLDPI